ncbi:hypothetical protein O6H91_05G090000 [Diphasiastrum complanatum]|uniref:Uncharacterized protein n=7 Tax=Diphasiastrum complanatum TaxID=34168 RepID=A0ACC2DR61_DIPCM|nr:hypothetical protein O6H91_05G084100 [Diphasiastrum complanatum]KAJ7556443.1 hypothetical protein O6H91_05G084100 [Diphasiastrum complanatum]KAJ7556444.1 hypothetical protein O6H91_05G084100 [Diphasiastrum complanatum]KAJ7556611.1 hypothetical protein O6H91_05G090000 [Diphasiastrum complanatum]KAJ7556612.1 hypothetical protein O6H91_05G090000 [Diphasiastrum complanatum]
METPSSKSPCTISRKIEREKRHFRERLSPDQVPRKTPGRKTPGRLQQSDRFIPHRSSIDFEVANFLLGKENISDHASPSKEEYMKQLAGDLLKDCSVSQKQTRILAFKSRPPPPPEGYGKQMRLLFSENSLPGVVKSRREFRHIPQAAERTLDAPDIVDDYYLNLLDWSSNNVIAVALANTIYLWNASSGSIEELMQAADEEGPITSVGWAPDGRHIAVGLNSAEVQIWDSFSLHQVRSLKGHSGRVGSLSWNGPILATGSRDCVIYNHDVRSREHITSRMVGHEQEVCGLKWSASGQQLASGGNDNCLIIWDAAAMSNRPSSYLHRLADHQAAVKALAWCPFKSNLLASGGGTADRCIKFWNTHTGACLQSVDTNSQVCALQWNRHERELLSSHGFSQNQLILWRYPSMVKMAELTGHSSRVLHLAQSPDGCTVASAAGDETLRFWQVFGMPDGKKTAIQSSSKEISSELNSRSIR